MEEDVLSECFQNLDSYTFSIKERSLKIQFYSNAKHSVRKAQE